MCLVRKVWACIVRRRFSLSLFLSTWKAAVRVRYIWASARFRSFVSPRSAERNTERQRARETGENFSLSRFSSPAFFSLSLSYSANALPSHVSVISIGASGPNYNQSSRPGRKKNSLEYFILFVVVDLVDGVELLVLAIDTITSIDALIQEKNKMRRLMYIEVKNEQHHQRFPVTACWLLTGSCPSSEIEREKDGQNNMRLRLISRLREEYVDPS